MKHRAIYTRWWWGNNYTIILENGVGTVELQFDENMPYVGYVKGLVVDSRERRKGYATELMNLCHAYARNEKMHFLELAVNKEEDWLCEWYRRLGFDILSSDEHEYLMIKVL